VRFSASLAHRNASVVIVNATFVGLAPGFKKGRFFFHTYGLTTYMINYVAGHAIDGWRTGRVTRWEEFSPILRSFNLGSFF
jgi:hypothetical protein